MLKKFLIGIAVVMATTSRSNAELLFSDNFNRVAGGLTGTTPVVSGGNWIQSGTVATSPIQINAQGSVAIGATGQDVYAALSAPAGVTAGTSLNATFRINVASASTGGDYFFHFSDPVGSTNFYNRIFAISSGAGFQLGVLGNSTGTATYGAGILNFGESIAVSSTWNFVAGTLNDTFSISVDGNPYHTGVWGGTNPEPISQVSAVNFRQGGPTTGATLTIDDLVVNGIVAVPEPSSWLLAGLGLGIVGLVRRHKKLVL